MNLKLTSLLWVLLLLAGSSAWGLQPWWNLKHTLWALGIMGLCVLPALGPVFWLRRRVREQTAVIREQLGRKASLEQRYLELFENASDIIYTHDMGGNFTSLNRAGEQITGYSRLEALRMSLLDVVVPEQALLAREWLERAGAGGSFPTREWEIVAKDGRRILLEVSARLIVQNGRPVGVQGIARDITDRKQADEALRKTTNTLRAVIEASPTAIVAVGKDGRVEIWNPAAERMFGWTRDEALGKPNPIVSSEKEQEYKENLSTALAGHLFSGRETRRRRKDGTVMDVVISAAPLSRAEGEITSAVGFLEDITKRKRAEEALLEERNTLRTLIDNLPDNVFIKDVEGRIVLDNIAHRQLLGVEAQEEVFGKTDFDFFPHELASAYFADEQAVISTGQAVVNRQEPTLDPAGNTHWLLTTKVPLRGSQGEIVGIVGVNRDVTERKQAEAALIEERHLLRTLLDNLPDYIYFKDRDSRFIRTNKAHATVFGLDDPAQAIGKTDFDFFTDEHAKPAFADEQEIIRTGQPMLTKEEKETWPDGRETWVSTTKMPLRDANGNVVGTFGISRDITERKRAGEALRESERRFRELLENVRLVAVGVDIEGRITFCNRHLLDLSGWRREELLGRDVLEVFVPPDCRDTKKLFKEPVGQGAMPPHFDAFIMTRAGERRLIAWNNTTLRDPAGNMIGIMSIGEDITQRRQAEEVLQQSHWFLQSTLNSLAAHIAILDEQGTIIAVNSAWVRFAQANEGDATAVGEGVNYLRVCDLAGAAGVEEAAKVAAGIRSILAGELGEFHLEYPCHSTHERRWFIVRATRFEGEGPLRVVVSHEDISERARAEGALRESDRRYRTLFENAHIGVYRTTPEGRILDANPALVRMLSYDSFAELASRNMEEEGFNPPYSRRQFKELLEKEGEVRGLESNWRRRDGAVICVRENAKAIRGENGQVLYYEGTVEDITERKRAEEALRESEERSRLAIDAATLTIWDWDLERNEITWSGYDLEAHLGLAAGQFEHCQESFLALVHPEDRELVDSSVKRALHEGAEYDIEFRFLRPDGSICWMTSRGQTVRDADGKPIRMIGVARDITERKQAEEALRDASERLDLALKASRVGIFTWSVVGNTIVWDEQTASLYGLKLHESPTSYESFLALVHPEDRERVHQAVTRSVEEAGEYNVEYRTVWADGSLHYIVVRARVYRDDNGQPERMIGVSWDVSELKRAEEELRKAKGAAEAASLAKSQFLATMSHEIRTPMNGIMGMTELALQTRLTREQREYLDMVRESADSLLTVINDILDFSKIEAGKLDLDAVEFDLRRCVDDAVRLMAPRAHQKGVEVLYEAHPDIPEVLVGDSTRLGQVLLNLVGNAVKFTERGEVVLTVEPESRTDQSMQLHFAIADTGIGIPDEKLKYIFEAFAQADSSTTRRFGGTGLGLAISSHLVEMMGGRIWVESKIGRGSTFHFTARFGVPQAPAAKDTPARTWSLEGLRVLVVDDNATNRRILKEMLAGWKMTPTAVDGGLLALEAMTTAEVRGEPFRLVLLDADMPGMDGFTLAERIMREPKFAGTAIMMLTSADQQADGARCREMGIAAYFVKPIRQRELREAIREAFAAAPDSLETPQVAIPRPLEQGGRKLRVLLAEDNAVNRGLALRILEKRGHRVEVATNGREVLGALQAANGKTFDVILMDVQMPEMDGLETTAAIRENEKATGVHIPIIAMTARAMKGDRERCLAAGMDGYVSKPIQARGLLKAIEALVPAQPRIAEMSFNSMSGIPILDEDALLARVDGDKTLLRELVEIFLADYPRMMEELRKAISSQDVKKLEAAAHALKGSVRNFVATDASEVAEELEILARQGQLAGAEEAFRVLEQRLELLAPALETFARRIAS